MFLQNKTSAGTIVDEMANTRALVHSNTMTKQSGKKVRASYQRTLSMSVLNSHIPVQVTDSHAYSHGTRAVIERKTLNKKFKSLDDLGEIGEADLQERSNQVESISKNTVEVLSIESVNSPSSTDKSGDLSASKSTENFNLSRDRFSDNADLSIEQIKNSKMTRSRKPSEGGNALSLNDDSVRESSTGTGMLSPSVKRHCKSKRKKRRNRKGFPSLCEDKTEMSNGTIEVYKRHRNKAKHKENLINNIQSHAKTRNVAENGAVSSNSNKREPHRPRQVSPLRGKLRLPKLKKSMELPYIKEPIQDGRFERLLQSLSRVNITGFK